MDELLTLTLLLMSRLPIYVYVIYKAWKFRNSMVLISTTWLGVMATAGAVGAITNTFVHEKLVTNLAGTIFAVALFMVGFTAKELIYKKKGS